MKKIVKNFRLAFLLIAVVFLAKETISQTNINYGETLTRNISVAGEVDIFTFSGTVGDIVIIRMSEGPSWSVYLEPLIKLFGPSGALLQESSDDAQAEIFIVLPGSGTFTIFSSDTEGDDTGDYGLFIQKIVNPGNAIPVEFGWTNTSSISTSGEVDTYTFLGVQGDIIVARMSEGPSWSVYLHPYLEIYGPSGDLLVVDADDAQARIYTQLPESGTYTVLASDGYPGNSNGDYGLCIQRTFNPVNAVPIEYGENITSNISTIGKIDTYTFSGNLGDIIVARMSEGPSWSVYLHPYLEIYGPSGDLLVVDSNDAQARIYTQLPESGIYTVFASDGYPGTSNGEYGIVIQRTFSPENAIPIEYGETFSSNISASGEVDTYTFYGSAGDSIILQLTEFSGWSVYLEPFVELYSPLGNFLSSDWDDSQAEIGYKLSESGTYTILVSDYYPGEDNGEYSIFLFGFTAPNTGTDILSYSFDEQSNEAIIDSIAHTVDIEVEYGTDLINLVATFTLSDGATATVGGILQVSGVSPNDFADPVTYEITAENGATMQDWIVTVTVATNTETDILSYSFSEQIGDAIIDMVAHTVDVEVEYDSDLTNLVASYTLSDGALATINGMNQFTGVTSNDFTNPITYVITAEDGITEQEWIVSVEKSSGIKEITIGNVNLYPNPFSQKTTIEFTNPNHSKHKLSVFSISGNKVLEMDNIRSDKVELEKGNLKPGVYIVELQGTKVYRKKIIIN